VEGIFAARNQNRNHCGFENGRNFAAIKSQQKRGRNQNRNHCGFENERNFAAIESQQKRGQNQNRNHCGFENGLVFGIKKPPCNGDARRLF
jgi:hypothetical protein